MNITVKGSVNSGVTWYTLHQSIEYCKKKYNSIKNETPDEKVNMWVYDELNHKPLLERIERLYPNEIIVGESGCLQLKSNDDRIPFHIDNIIAEAVNWKSGDVVIINLPIIITSLNNPSDFIERKTIKFALSAIQKRIGVIMYLQEQLNRNEEVDFKETYKHDKFEWNIKTNGDTQCVKLINF